MLKQTNILAMSSVSGTVIFLIDWLKRFSLKICKNLRQISEILFPSKFTTYRKKNLHLLLYLLNIKSIQ